MGGPNLITPPVFKEEVWSEYEKVKQSLQLAAVFKLDKDEKFMILHGVALEKWNQLLALIDDQNVYWIVVNFPYSTTNGGQRRKLIFCTYCPDSLKRGTFRETVRIKTSAVMMAAELATKTVQDGALRLQANCMEDLDLLRVLECASKYEKDSVDKSSMEKLL